VAETLELQDNAERNSWPICPRCGSNEFVHRGGLDHRLQYPPRQRFACTRCGKDHRFLAPDAPRYKPGRLKRYREKIIRREAPLASYGTWRIRAELARSLSCMWRQSVGHGLLTPDQAALDKFASEIIETEVSTFRMMHPQEVFRAFGKPVLKAEAPKVEPPKVIDPLREAVPYA
jgi:hypothetical protein